MIGVVPRRPTASRRLLFVLFPLRHFNRRSSRHVSHQEIHQDVLAVLALFHRFVQQRTQPFGVQNVVVPMVERRAGQYYRIIVGPLGRVPPGTFSVVPVMRTSGIADDSIWKLLPHLERKVDFVGRQHRVFVQRQYRGCLDQWMRIESL